MVTKLGLIFLFLFIAISAKAFNQDDAVEMLSTMNKELICLAKVVDDEARGESYNGKVAVASVVMNRVNSGQFPDTICGVANQRWKGVCQFSGMCKNKQKRFDAISLKVAYNVFIEGSHKDPTKGATHFHNNTVSPNWSNIYARTVRIGNHTFYRNSKRKN